MVKLQKAVLQTLAYADVFDYPLTAKEIHCFLINKRSFLEEIMASLKQHPAIDSRAGFYFIKGKGKTVSLRKKRARASEEKLRLARQIGDWFRFIPWIKLVGVTGALAMKAAKEEDDIDLLIITARDRLWLTRGLLASFLRFLGLYRRPNKIKNRICLNMFLDEDHLGVPPKERDLFSAHEVCQLKVIWERQGTYQKFLKENQWVTKFLPNWKN